LDFHHIGLVVAVNADQMIHFPDFRAHERAFSLLTQVAGRTGRRNRKDRIIIQTYQPGHPVITHFLQNDYTGMFQREIRERELFKYPPFYRLVKLEIKSKNPENLNRAAQWLAEAFRYYFKHVLGPSEPPVYKIRNYYHLEILLKFPSEQNTMPAREIIRKILKKFKAIKQFGNVRIKVNADP
jgi:primosomal protein N' (replication factor Y)